MAASALILVTCQGATQGATALFPGGLPGTIRDDAGVYLTCRGHSCTPNDAPQRVHELRRDKEAVERAAALRALGLTLQATADQLAAEGFTRPKGGTWTPSAVASALRSHALDQQAAA